MYPCACLIILLTHLVQDEQNPAARDIVLKRVEGYMTRAEQLRELVERSNASPRRGGGAGAGASDSHGGGGSAAQAKDHKEDDSEEKKMQGALACIFPAFYCIFTLFIIPAINSGDRDRETQCEMG